MRAFLLICTLVPSLPALAANPVPAAYGPLWSFAKDGRQHYLFGTLHVGKPEHARLDNGLRCALQGSDSLALELDISQREVVAQLQQQMAEAAPAQWRQLHAPLQQRLRKQASQLGISASQAQAMPPAMIIIAYTMAGIADSGLSPAYGSERSLLKLAGSKPVLSLESVDTQARALGGMPPAVIEESVNLLEQNLPKAMLQMKTQLGELMQSWERADLPAMEAAAHDPQQQAASRWMNDAMLVQRNLPMAQQIDRLARQQKLFVAVGALHLPGKQGLLALLQVRGYRLQALTAAQRLAARADCRN